MEGKLQAKLAHPVPGEGGTPLYGLYRYVRPQRVWFFSRFSHKWGIDFS